MVALQWLGEVNFAFTLSSVVAYAFCVLFSQIKDTVFVINLYNWFSQFWTDVIFELTSYTFQYKCDRLQPRYALLQYIWKSWVCYFVWLLGWHVTALIGIFGIVLCWLTPQNDMSG